MRVPIEIGQGSKTKSIWVLVSPRKHVRLGLIGSVVESGVIFGVKRPICFLPTPPSHKEIRFDTDCGTTSGTADQ